MSGELLRFGPYTLDPALLELRRDGERVRIQAKPLALLLYLIRNSDRVVSHEEIRREVWPGIRVEPGALKSAMHLLRRALAEGADDPGPDAEGEWIASVHGAGYRFAHRPERVRVDAATGPAATPAPGGRPRDFVDRETEMERLRALCRAALQGERQIALLGGPPGIGKTRTATELATEAEALGFEIHIGRAHEGDGAPPFWPWAQILRSWTAAHGSTRLEELAGSGSRAADLLGLAPDLELEPGARPTSAYTQVDQGRFRMLDRVSRFLERASSERPLLLIIDDLHRADSASIELLLFVAQHVGRARLAIVGTHRPLQAQHALGRVLHESGACSIPLSGLVRSSVDDILTQACGRRIPAELVDRVHAASGGNPLFAYELARALAGSGRADAALPVRVHDAVWGRICECSPACLALLRLASAAGPELTLPILREALGDALTARALLDALAEAERGDLLTGTGGIYRFVHGVVREALYEKLGPTERMQLHRQIGEALERLQGSQPATRLAELAHHFLESAALHDPERAVRHARRAAEAARAVCAFSDEVALRRRALRALDFIERPVPELRGQLRIELGDALGRGAAPIAELQRVFVEALAIARTEGASQLLARAAERCAWHMWVRGSFLPVITPSSDQALVSALVADLTRVQETSDVQSDPTLHARVCLALAGVAGQDSPEESRSAFERAVAISARSTDRELRGEVLMLRYSFLYDDLAARATLQQEALAWTLATQNQWFEVDAHFLAMNDALERGDRASYERAGAELERMAALGIPSAVYSAESRRFLSAQLEGPIVAATGRALELARTGRRLNLDRDWVMWTLSLQMGWLMLHAGRTELLLRQDDAYRVPVADVAELRTARAHLYALVGRHDEARELLAELPRKRIGFGRGEIWMGAMLSAAQACALLGDAERALPIFEALAPYADRFASVVTMVFGPVARHLGALAAVLERWSEAEELFAAAAQQARELRAPVFSALVAADRALAFRTHPAARMRRESAVLGARAESEARALGLDGVATLLAKAKR